MFNNNLKNKKEELQTEIANIEKRKNELMKELMKLIGERDDLLSQTNALSKDITSLNAQKNELREQLTNLKDIESNTLERIKQSEQFILDTEIKYMDNMSGLDFESYFEKILNALGYDAIKTKASRDGGADILAELNNKKYVYQCKHYSQTVGNKAIQEIFTAKQLNHCDYAIVVTNNFFTKQAISEANQLDVILYDRNKLISILAKYLKLSYLNIKDENINSNDGEFYVFENVVKFAIENKKISPYTIERQFNMSYLLACKFIDCMEKNKIISEYQGNKPRDVLITIKDWDNLKHKIKNTIAIL